MSDGPFRNLKLSSKWKRYGEQLASDAATTLERARQACRALLEDLAPAEFSALFRKLSELKDNPQLELEPAATVKAILAEQIPSPIADVFGRNLLANLRDALPLATSLDAALHETVIEMTDLTQNRIEEYCLHARDVGDMKVEAFDTASARNRETFASIDLTAFGTALIDGNKNAFDDSIMVRSGVDEGPEE